MFIYTENDTESNKHIKNIKWIITNTPEYKNIFPEIPKVRERTKKLKMFEKCFY